MSRTDKSLDAWHVADARAGGDAAFARLVRAWHRRLVAHGWRLLRDRDRAEEAVQQAWMEIARGLPRLRDDRAFPAWAYRIVTRRCARIVAGQVRDRHLTATLEPEPGQRDAVEDRSDAARLRQAVRALPPDQRAAIALFYFEELSVAEVAVALDVPVGTIKTRLMHARRKLRTDLEGDE